MRQHCVKVSGEVHKKHFGTSILASPDGKYVGCNSVSTASSSICLSCLCEIDTVQELQGGSPSQKYDYYGALPGSGKRT